MQYTFASVLCLVSALLPAPAGKPNPKWQYHLPKGKKYAFHFTYKSEAHSAGPNSNMQQSLDADIDITVKNVDPKGNMELDIKAKNVQEKFQKNGDWSPAPISLLQESDVSIDPTGYMLSGKILHEDTSRQTGKQKLTEEQVLERSLRQVVYRLPQRESFFNGYSWLDTFPQPAPIKPGTPAAKAPKPTGPPPLQTFAKYTVSAGTAADPKIIWELKAESHRNGKLAGKDIAEATHSIFTFADATSMISAYQTTTETHSGGDYFKTTKELKMKF